MAIAVPMTAPPGPPTQLKIEIPNGTNIRFGILAQPAFQAAQSNALNGWSDNFFVRRTRVLVGGSVAGMFDYFFDTDFPNIGMATDVTTPAAMAGDPPTYSVSKTTPGLNVQDIFVTWKSLGDALKVDVGYMLPPLSHNAVQGAGTLFGWDYFAFSFLHSGLYAQNTVSPVGRDTGVQLRGLVANGMLEYRVGAFQGVRKARTATDVGSSNIPRIVARLQLNLMDAEPGFFYAGTYFGKKKIVSIGGSFDYNKNPADGTSFDDSYYAYDVDAFADLPVGPGVLTAQVDFLGMHAGTLIGTLPKNAFMGEVGYTITDAKVSPIVRYERQWGAAATGATATTPPTLDRMALGLAYWPAGHNVNLKIFYSYIKSNAMNAHGASQVNAQLQLYYF